MMEPHWILQENIYREHGWERLVDALNGVGASYTIVTIVPFEHRLEPEPVINGPVLVMGSVTLVQIAQQRGWMPGAFHNENFRTEYCLEVFGSDHLNYDAWVGRFADAVFPSDRMHVRPCDDLKLFSGQVYDREDFVAWQESVRHGAESTRGSVKPDTTIAVSSVKSIHEEARFFVVNDEIVASSAYRTDGMLSYSITTSDALEEFAQQSLERWHPSDAYCLDIALTDDGPKMIEINCINCSGFYAADVTRLVEALDGIAVRSYMQ